MSLIIEYAIFFLVILVIAAEFYKIRFESNKESKDERGLQLIYKSKSLSYSILSGGIIIGVILVGALKLVPTEAFILIIMITYFVQSIASSVYLFYCRKI
ncbi:hypothetical protein MKZ25_08725 [Solibacillus sp. FSL W7-1464]|uniref:hypothetical protein n=1 Tax=Solibacillus sp. FSL W7-1464 TaxID=2921706 RepID=UPI0030FA8B74